ADVVPWICTFMVRDTLSLRGWKISPTTACARSVRIVESEATCIQSGLEIDFHSSQIHAVCFIHKYANTFNIVLRITFLLLVEAQDITHSRATTTLYTNPKSKIRTYLLLIDELSKLTQCACCQCDRRRRCDIICMHYLSFPMMIY